MKHSTIFRWAIVAGIAISIVAMESLTFAQAPRTISYQGVIQQGTALASGNVNMTVNYYYVGTTQSLFTEIFHNVPVTGGVFNLDLGSTVGGVPTSIDWSMPIEIGITINGGEE